LCMLLHQPCWHLSAKLDAPNYITLMPLPPKSPELNPVENIWQFIRDNWLSNRVFRSYDDIVDHCCFAWNRLVDLPWTIMSIGLRNWAHGSDQRDLVLYAKRRIAPAPKVERKYTAVNTLCGTPRSCAYKQAARDAYIES